MAQEYKPKSFEESEREQSEKSAAPQKRMEQMRLDTYNWMKNEPAIQEYLQQFSSFSQDNFMRDYAFCKSMFMEYADSQAAIHESREEGNIEQAQTRLMDIQMKKLFDVMLQWDAGLVQPEGIECSWDFFKWEHKLSECPFISPVSEEEFNLYMQYAQSENFNYDLHLSMIDLTHFQEHDYSDLPEWFLFENLHTGNGKYLLLPQIRTEKEEFYRGLCHQESAELLDAKYESGELQKPTVDTRPSAPGSYYKGIEDFVKRFENRETMSKFYKYYECNTDQLIRDNEEDEEHGYLNERVNDIMIYMQDVKEKIPVNANSDWRRAVIEAYENYNRHQVQIGLQYAYSDYCNRLSNGLGYLTDEKSFRETDGLAKMVSEQILRGRELNGEPRNFDF